MAVLGQAIRTDDLNITATLVVKVIVDTVVMRSPDDNFIVVFPRRMRNLVLGFLIVEGANLVRVEVFIELR